jgi:carbamoyl-phosphate synthase small subunit
VVDPKTALLALEDGTVFRGHSCGAEGEADGELCFNTSLAGYEEVLTDPSYAGQIITFTYPHIGNYGVNGDDDEARTIHCRGLIVRDLARRASNWRATEDLQGYLERHQIAGIAGIDTRRLTRHIREASRFGEGRAFCRHHQHGRQGFHVLGFQHSREALVHIRAPYPSG